MIWIMESVWECYILQCHKEVARPHKIHFFMVETSLRSVNCLDRRSNHCKIFSRFKQSVRDHTKGKRKKFRDYIFW